jgi:hypothetical protein
MPLRTVRGDITSRCYPRSLTLVPSVETTLVEDNISVGNISIIVKRETTKVERVDSKDQRMVGQVWFLPGELSSLAGIKTRFVRRIDNRNGISRTLSTFGVHQDKSPIFEYLKARDIAMVRKLLSEYKVARNDRDKSGHSLWVTFSQHDIS